MTPTTDRVKMILDDLDSVQENLLALSDDIWLNIDHSDNDAVDAGAAFKKQFNQKLEGFGRTGENIRSTLETTINSAINKGELEKRGSEVRVNQVS